MMMSSMRTSRKRRINIKNLAIFLGAILGICLIVTALGFRLLSRRDPGSDSGGEKSAAASAAGTSGVDYSSFWNAKAEVNQDAPLYVKGDHGFAQQGTFRAGSILDIIEDSQKTFLHVADSDFYISGDQVKKSDRWYRNDTSLVPYGKTVHAAAGYQLQDVSGRVLLQEDQQRSYQVYVLPSDSDPRYGVRFQNAVAYLPKEQAESVSEDGDAPDEPLAEHIPVLMYHFFYSEKDGGTRKDANDVEVGELQEQVDWLNQAQYHTLTMREVQYFMEGRAQIPAKSVAITIDDADPSVHQYAYPILRDAKIHATLFVICGWQPAAMPYDLWEMREDGIELQSHSFLMHQGGCSGEGHGGRLLCIAYEEGLKDTKESFDYVDGGFVYCYPFGDVNDSAEKIVRDAGAKLAFTTQPGKIDPSMDPLALPRVRVRGGAGLASYQAGIED